MQYIAGCQEPIVLDYISKGSVLPTSDIDILVLRNRYLRFVKRKWSTAPSYRWIVLLAVSSLTACAKT